MTTWQREVSVVVLNHLWPLILISIIIVGPPYRDMGMLRLLRQRLEEGGIMVQPSKLFDTGNYCLTVGIIGIQN